jgi:isopentenyl diphosphate isomerase/L-lactate dehydrogenase-like FMN-dependent dehydrogenase
MKEALLTTRLTCGDPTFASLTHAPATPLSQHLDNTTKRALKRIADRGTRRFSGKRRNFGIRQNPRNCGVFVMRTAPPRNFRSFACMTAAPDPALVCLPDYERAAAARLDDRAQAWINGAAGDELTVSDNIAAWQRLAFAPRVFAGAQDPDLEVVVLGRPRPHPVIIAPTAFASLAHPEADVGVARAALATATTMCLSTLASVSPAGLAAEVPGVPRWFQLYVFRDRGVTESLIAEAEASGFEALVVTADRPVLGVRDRESRERVRGAAPAIDTVHSRDPTETGSRIDPAVTWADIAGFAADSTLPVIVKGVLTAADARLAVEHGAAGVIVSNHGGRQLDTALAGADALPAIADAVGGAIDVLVDGGVRRGTDVVKALALGARAVLIGRPALWGLSVGGAAGVQRVLELLISETRVALSLAGAARAATVDPGLVVRAPWAPS